MEKKKIIKKKKKNFKKSLQFNQNGEKFKLKHFKKKYIKLKYKNRVDH